MPGREINAVFATSMREWADAVFIGIGPFFNSRRIELVRTIFRALSWTCGSVTRRSTSESSRVAAGRAIQKE
jgi:hypothetical protein